MQSKIWQTVIRSIHFVLRVLQVRKCKGKTAVKDVGILSKESEGKTLEFDFYMLDCSFQAFAITFNCLHCAILLQCQRNYGSFSNKMGKNILYI